MLVPSHRVMFPSVSPTKSLEPLPPFFFLQNLASPPYFSSPLQALPHLVLDQTFRSSSDSLGPLASGLVCPLLKFITFQILVFASPFSLGSFSDCILSQYNGPHIGLDSIPDFLRSHLSRIFSLPSRPSLFQTFFPIVPIFYPHNALPYVSG